MEQLKQSTSTLPITIDDALREIAAMKPKEISLFDTTRRIHAWARYARASISEGELKLADACIQVIEEITSWEFQGQGEGEREG